MFAHTNSTHIRLVANGHAYMHCASTSHYTRTYIYSDSTIVAANLPIRGMIYARLIVRLCV